MNVLNVNSSLDLNTGGGTAERTYQMSRFLSKLDTVRCTVLTFEIGTDQSRIDQLTGVRVVRLSRLYKRFNIPIWRNSLIQRLVRDADLIHLMDHWSILNYLVASEAAVQKKPYVICPAGSLPIYGRSPVLKKLYNHFAGYALVKNASGWIAVTSGEFPHFERYGIRASKVVEIPNGICEDDFPDISHKSFKSKFHLPDCPLILFMGRLNKIKGPDLLLQAFIQAQNELKGAHLVFAGPDCGMLAELTKMADSGNVTDRVHFLGYLCGMDKVAAYRSARLLVVPSRHDAMSIVALEAGICGTPVLLTDQCGFHHICNVDPRLEVAATITGLATGLINLLTPSDLLDKISPIYREYICTRYSWSKIALDYLAFYKTVIGIH